MFTVGLLPTELVLELAEHMDIVSLKHFMMTNKGLRQLIGAFEKSISDAKASAFTFTPAGNVLSSATVERRVLRAGTFDLVAELELRDSRIDDLLQRGNAFIDVASPAGLEGLTSAQQARLALLLRRALYHCDRIADLAANPPCEPIAEDHYALIPTGVWAQPGPLYPEDLRDRDPFANPGARAAQLAYIRLLCPRDAALLFYLVTALGASFSFARRIYESSDPAAWERVTVFEECILRHGTYFLWSYVCGGRGEMKEMSGHMLGAGLVELTDWESGKEGMQPGLRMTLLDRFREAYGDEDGKDGDDNNLHVTLHMLKLVKDMVCGSDKGDRAAGGVGNVDGPESTEIGSPESDDNAEGVKK